MLKFHEIAEGSHRILNPFNPEKYELLGEICAFQKGQNLLDLACGKGEMLSQWALKYGITGTGVDLSTVFLGAAQQRIRELGVSNRINLIESEGAAYMASVKPVFDTVCCIGATWIGNGLKGTIDLLKPALKDPNGLILIGEPFWLDPPPVEAITPMAGTAEMYTTLAGTLQRFEDSGLELIEMVLANQDTWDRYEASQWKTCHQWLQENPEDPDHAALSEWIASNRRQYLTWGRRYFGWGVFVLKQRVC